MAGEWNSVPLGELCDEERGISYGIVKVGEFISDGVPVVRGGDIRNGRIICDDSKRVTADVSNQFRRTILQGGEIVLNLIADPGHSAIVPRELAGHNVSRDVAVIPLNGRSDVRFVDFFLKSKIAVDWLTARLQGSVTQKINLGTLRELPIPQPPLPEQKSIAAVLGALDDKIELNRRMNATLEATARALFQSWFVDFDPVRAKLDGRQPVGMDEATVALFPDGFEESLLGHIPKGWTIRPVGEVVDCVGGGTPSTGESKYWEGGTHHWTTPKDFSSLQAPILLDTYRKVTDAGIAKISSGLLPAGTLLLSSRAPVGYLAIAAMPIAINQGFIALKCNERASNFFMLNWCQTNMAEIESRATGTTFAEISKQNFRPIRVVLPPRELMAAFTAKVAQFYVQITTNLNQSRTLATLRDTLLPKLLSGELRVERDYGNLSFKA